MYRMHVTRSNITTYYLLSNGNSSLNNTTILAKILLYGKLVELFYNGGDCYIKKKSDSVVSNDGR